MSCLSHCSLLLLHSKPRTMVQTARQSFVLFQNSGTVVGTTGCDHIGTMFSACGNTQQSCSLWVQHRQVLIHRRLIFPGSFSRSFFMLYRIRAYACPVYVACEAESKAQKEKCCSFRRRIVSTVRRQYSRGEGQLVAGVTTSQLRMHEKSIVIAAPAYRGIQQTQA